MTTVRAHCLADLTAPPPPSRTGLPFGRNPRSRPQPPPAPPLRARSTPHFAAGSYLVVFHPRRRRSAHCLFHCLREVVRIATKELRGSALRRFMAEIVRKLGRGGQRTAAREFGWSRDTIRKGEHELATGIECVDGRCGKRAGIDERLPNLKADIKDVVGCWSQTDPRFRTTQRYSRLSVPEVAKRLVRDKGYEDRQLPSNETIRKLMHELGFRPRKVRKAKPKKKSRKPTRSSASCSK